jgi:hypothetical protein
MARTDNGHGWTHGLMFVWLLGSFLLTGCATIVPEAFIIKNYKNGALPMEQVAIVFTSAGHKHGTIKITSIAEGLGMDGGNKINHYYVLLRPGRYTLDIDATMTAGPSAVMLDNNLVMVTNPTWNIGIPVSRTLEAKAGYVYYLKGALDPAQQRWQAEIDEISFGAILEGNDAFFIERYGFVEKHYNDPDIPMLSTN